MSNRETAGRTTCPICGEPLQDVRVNKNNKLYIYCDNGCSCKFNNKQSRQYLPLLLQGQNVTDSKIGLITSVKTKEIKQNGQSIQWKQPKPSAADVAGKYRATTDGRTDQSNTGVLPSGRSPTRGILSSFFSDDDE